VGALPEAVVAGDLDLDGDLDLASADANFPGDIGLLFGAGGGEFSAGPPLAPSDTPRGLIAADLNSDGALDLVAHGFGGVEVFLHQQGPAFLPPLPLSVGILPSFVISADLNGDSAPDLVAASQELNAITPALSAP
jgi:hypothetical protein